MTSEPRNPERLPADDRSLITIILAAGLGKRMKSDLPKVLHPLAGRPLLHYVLDLSETIGSARTLVVVGHRREQVMEASRNFQVEWVVQDRQLGTGDAVKRCLPHLKGYSGQLLVLSGDVPLLKPDTVHKALALHLRTGAAATVFTFKPADPAGYGRIVRGAGDRLLCIVEERDATPEERSISEVNGGVYIFDAPTLAPTLSQIDNRNALGEYYLTDSIGILASSGRILSAFLVDDPLELAGVNSPEQLAQLEWEWLRRRQDKS